MPYLEDVSVPMSVAGIVAPESVERAHSFLTPNSLNFCQTVSHQHGAAAAIDSEPDVALPTSVLRPSNPAEALTYQIIGQTLSGAEANFANVGVPWLPPTRRVTKLRDSEDLEDYLKINLVEVKTVALEEYSEDLRTAAHEAMHQALFIQVPSPVERHGLSLITFAGVLAVVTILAKAASIEPTSAFMLSAIFGGGSAMFASIFTTDEYRRSSFLGALEKEIARRNGQSGSGTNNFQVCPTG